MNRYNEIISTMSDRLDQYHIPHTVNDCFSQGAQIRFPWCDGDIAINDGTYGHELGDVESYKFPWDDGDVSQLEPEDAVERIVQLYIEMVQDYFSIVSPFVPALAD
jgi:hypothetical protein